MVGWRGVGPWLVLVLLFATLPNHARGETMAERARRFSADAAALGRSVPVEGSEGARVRMAMFLTAELHDLRRVDFAALDQAGRVDWLLLKNHLEGELEGLELGIRKSREVEALLPFARGIVELEESRRRMERPDPERAASRVAEIAAMVETARDGLAKRAGAKEPRAEWDSPVLGRRAAMEVDKLARAFRDWLRFYQGYDPEMTWWVEQPGKDLSEALARYAKLLRAEVAGYKEGADEPVIGDPIGREALLAALHREMIPLSPEELIEIANEEFAWCEREYKRAANELGFGDDWRRALEHVKRLHVRPGEQPGLIKQLADEAVAFLEERDLLTIPPLAKEVWRMEMMSPERQKVNPYFTGGEVISVSFPTDSMSHGEKVMSLRGNNIHFCRATVHHELIPGHHLQIFQSQRFNTHRRAFTTPFLIEGWALYWEMLLWDLQFQQSPEDRIGALFWRSHRCARIIFSLNFHLGKMTAAEAIQFLVDRVGHEPTGATAEVRRSVAGDYSPLYQAAYMLGGLQLRALHKELVATGRMTPRQFHDAVLEQNAIPVTLIRAALTGQELTPDGPAPWRFREPLKPAASTDGPPPPQTEQKPNLEVYRDQVRPHWFGEGKFWYSNALADGAKEFVLVDAAAPEKRPAFDHARLALELGKVAGAKLDGAKLPFDEITLSPDLARVAVEFQGRGWEVDLVTYAAMPAGEKPAEAKPMVEERPRGRGGRGAGGDPHAAARAAARSPDGQWEVVVKGHNLFLRPLGGRSEAERQLTFDANPASSYRLDASRDRLVGMNYDKPDPEDSLPDISWAPDSRHFIAMRTRAGGFREVHLVESSPRDQLQPKLSAYPYLKPGDEIPITKPRLFAVEGGREIPVDDSLSPNPWSIDSARWSDDSARFRMLYNQRGHQVMRLLSIEAATGAVRPLVEEVAATFIDYAGKRFLEVLEGSNEAIWMSERDGWNHLYLYDIAAGAVKTQITRGQWVVRRVERVDAEKRQIWFYASGWHPGQSPYHLHLARVNFDGGGLIFLTQGDGTHRAEFSPDRRWLIDTWSRVDQPPVTELRDAETGQLLLELERADVANLERAGVPFPERFVAKGRDGVTDIWGVVHWPSGLDRSRKYPVIENIYAGPHSSHVPVGFRASHGQRQFTDRGFVVVQIDGMGTSNRSKQFHDVCWKNLVDAGLPDRILWMRALARKHPHLDLERVGIYGGSAGGQNAVAALLHHGDFYKVGAADCGCHDNRMDKIWWNELWMGWPVGPHYAENSNVTHAAKLQGKLLLTVGELDRNVDPSSTFQLANALIQAGKDVDFLVIPGAGHGAAEGPFGRRKRMEFFVEHLKP